VFEFVVGLLKHVRQKNQSRKKTCHFVRGHKKASFVHNREILHEAEKSSSCQTIQRTNRQTWIKLVTSCLTFCTVQYLISNSPS